MSQDPSITTANGRYFLTDRIRDEVNFQSTPQAQGVPRPPLQKPFPAGSRLIPLPGRESWSIPRSNLEDAIAERQSHRHFTDEPLTLTELAFLLWSTQGVRETLHPAAVMRTVPSAGCRHPFETYLAILNVEGLDSGLYRYLPLEHALVHLCEVNNLPARSLPPVVVKDSVAKRQSPSSGQSFQSALNGAMAKHPTRSSPLMPVIFAKIFISPAPLSRPAPARLPLTTRPWRTNCWLWMGGRVHHLYFASGEDSDSAMSIETPATPLNWQVYILLCSDHSLYTGITTDITRRFQQHVNGRGAKYFRGRQPLQVVYLETEHSRASASRREAFIKGLKRADKERLLLNEKSEAP